MNLLFPIAGLILLIGISVYLHAVIKFSDIVQTEHPEWINRRGTLSFLYTGMPPSADPNVSLAILGIIFSARWRALRSPMAATYVGRIRILFPLLVTVFVGVLVAVAVLKP
jgi:hypothetical protein